MYINVSFISISTVAVIAVIIERALKSYAVWLDIQDRLRARKIQNASQQPADKIAYFSRRLSFRDWLAISQVVLSIVAGGCMFFMLVFISPSDPRWFMALLAILVVSSLRPNKLQ